MPCTLTAGACVNWRAVPGGLPQDETQAIFHEYDVVAKLAVLDELAEEAKLLQDGYVEQASSGHLLESAHSTALSPPPLSSMLHTSRIQGSSYQA